jgi:hypothetical protein
MTSQKTRLPRLTRTRPGHYQLELNRAGVSITCFVDAYNTEDRPSKPHWLYLVTIPKDNGTILRSSRGFSNRYNAVENMMAYLNGPQVFKDLVNAGEIPDERLPWVTSGTSSEQPEPEPETNWPPEANGLSYKIVATQPETNSRQPYHDIEDKLTRLSKEYGVLMDNYQAFVMEWGNHFGFLAEKNHRESIESIDEVAGILHQAIRSAQEVSDETSLFVIYCTGNGSDFYAEKYKNGVKLPDFTSNRLGQFYWLVDRVFATSETSAELAFRTRIPALVVKVRSIEKRLEDVTKQYTDRTRVDPLYIEMKEDVILSSSYGVFEQSSRNVEMLLALKAKFLSYYRNYNYTPPNIEPADHDKDDDL